MLSAFRNFVPVLLKGTRMGANRQAGPPAVLAARAVASRSMVRRVSAKSRAESRHGTINKSQTFMIASVVEGCSEGPSTTT